MSPLAFLAYLFIHFSIIGTKVFEILRNGVKPLDVLSTKKNYNVKYVTLKFEVCCRNLIIQLVAPALNAFFCNTKI